jgi:hypothetical protein
MRPGIRSVANSYWHRTIYPVKLGLHAGAVPPDACMVVSDNVSTNIYSFLKMKLVGTALRCSPCKRTPMALLFLSRLRQLAKSYIIQREAYYCGFLWIPRDSYGFLWIPMDSYGFLWTPMDSYGFLWICIARCQHVSIVRFLASICRSRDGGRLKSTAFRDIHKDSYEFLWIPVNSYGFLWIPMDPYGFLWIPMDSYGFLWIPMDSYGFLWIPMDSYGFLWIPMYSNTKNCTEYWKQQATLNIL